jgi:hypothetical protein
MARVVVGCTGDLLVVQVHREKVETPQRLEDVAAEFPTSATLFARGLGFALRGGISNAATAVDVLGERRLGCVESYL